MPFAEMPGWPAPRRRVIAAGCSSARCEGCRWPASRGGCTCTRASRARQVVEPVLLMGRLGARTLLLTNASGGVNPDFGAGTLMVITGPHQPDRADAAPRPERRRARAALPRPDRRLGPGAARAAARGGRSRRASSSQRASTPGCSARPTRRPPRCACCGSLAPTRSGCPRSWRRSPRAGRACACAASRSSRTPGPGCHPRR